MTFVGASHIINSVNLHELMLHSLIDKEDWYGVMDLYAEWAPDNKEKCHTGFAKTKMPLEQFTSPWGIINFLKESGVNQDLAEHTRLRISTILSKDPASAEKKAKVFSKLFQTLIETKKKNLKKREAKHKVEAAKKQRNAEKALEQFFQNDLPLQDVLVTEEPVVSEPTTEMSDSTGKIMVELLKAGAKEIKSPDGWVVQS